MPQRQLRAEELDGLRAGLKADQLNVLLISIDTLRADRLSCYGSDVATPNMDRLAREGVRFDNASTTVPYTFPAHSSMMTGNYPPTHGIRENVGYFLGDEHETLAEVMQRSGRETAGFVSAFVLDSRWGIAQGFEHYFDDFDLGAFQDPNLGSVQRPGSETIAVFQRWLDERTAGASTAARPFFAFLHLYDPHDPYTPPEPYRSLYPGRPYDAEVAYTDELIGGLYQDLEERGLLENTLVVLTSDHGEGLGEHGETFHGLLIYDSTVRVPLLARFPSGDLAGTVVSEAVSHVDLAPTIASWAGAKGMDAVQGRSLLPTLLSAPLSPAAGEGASAGQETEERLVYAESFYPLTHYGWAPLRSLRGERFKYIESPAPELFAIQTDPNEQSNLYDSSERTSREMARALRAFAEQIEAPATNAVIDLDERSIAHLRALGYISGQGGVDLASYDPDVERPDPKARIHLHRLIMQAQSHVSAERDDRARVLLTRVLEEDPQLLDGHYLLGNIALHGGDPARAQGHFRDALSVDDTHRPSVFGLASAHLDLGRPDEALLGFERVLQLAGQDSKATVAIADIQVSQGDLDSARETLRDAAVDDAPPIVFNRLGEVLALSGDPVAAAEWFISASRANTGFAQPSFNLAVLAEQSGRPAEAVEHYQQAIERAPKHFRSQFNLGRLLQTMGERERGFEFLRQSIDSNPEFAMGRFFLGKSLMDSNRLAEAETMTREGLDLNAESKLGWFVLADILNRQGKAADANAALERGRALERQ